MLQKIPNLKQSDSSGIGISLVPETMSLTRTSFDTLIARFRSICGDEFVSTAESDILRYGQDETRNLRFAFDALIKPANAEEISRILLICNEVGIPVTPRGGGSGVTGGALPVQRGIVISLERLNKIIRIDDVDNYVVAESGVVTALLCDALENAGYYFPVQPTSSAQSFIGGNVAENAGSINSCRYGVTGDYVLNLEVVLPTGEVIWTGANVSKNATGLNITQLFVGSEGILGIITKVVYRIIKRPSHDLILLAPFKTLRSACNALYEIKRSGIKPSVTELICHNALMLLTEFFESAEAPDHDETQLLIELQEINQDILTVSMSEITAILEQFTDQDVLVAFSSSEKKKLKMGRSHIGEALKRHYAEYRDIDVCMPVNCLHDYILEIERIVAKHQLSLISFGHALDGNLHNMIVSSDRGILDEDLVRAAVTEIFSYAIANGGVISGEHGIGLLQKEFIPLQFSAPLLQLVNRVKTQFDPNGILNPGKKI